MMMMTITTMTVTIIIDNIIITGIIFIGVGSCFKVYVCVWGGGEI